MNTSRAGWLSRSLLSLPVPYYPAEKSHNSVIGGREVSLAHSLNAQLLLHNCFPSYPTMTPHPNLLVLSFIFSYNLQIYELSITNNDKTICSFHTPIGMVTMVSIQPLSSFWSRAPLSKAFTTSHLMMIWETYDIYIRLQLPYSTCCCCLLVASTCYLYLLLLNITCRDWKAIAATFVSSLMERPPAGHTGHIGHSRPTSNRNTPSPLSPSLWA